MKRRRLFLLIPVMCSMMCICAQSVPDEQEPLLPGSLTGLSSKYADKVAEKASQLEEKLDRKSAAALEKFQKIEMKMQRKLAKLDSSKAKQLFDNTVQQYARVKQRLQQDKILQQYIPSLDSMGSSLKFMQNNSALIAGAKQAQQKIKDAMGKVKGLETQFQKAEEIKAFLKERRQQLKQQLQQFGFTKQLKKLNKQAYYYGQQVAEYKDILADHKKIERKVLQLLSRTKLFRDFMQKNSMLASLFPMQGGGTTGPGAQSGFAGLQTRAQVTSYIQQAVLSAPNAMPRIQQNIQDAQSQVTELRNKLSHLIGAGGEDLEMPDFKPNSQKTKSFRKRLEYGMNVQSQRANMFFPVTSDLALSLGYKLNDKSIIGVGISYKIGLGTGWKNIRITNQGMGLRSFIEWKLKKSFWLTGGYEQNYRVSPGVSVVAPPSGGWGVQESGLLGLSQSVPLKTKFFKKLKFQLLWDFLSYRQLPRAQPVLFRAGYNF